MYVAKLFSDKNWTEIANKNFLEFFSKLQEKTLVILVIGPFFYENADENRRHKHLL